MKKTRRILSMLLAAVTVFGILPVTAFAEDPPTYLAIGDSISTGAGLTTPDTEAFPILVQAALKEEGHTYNLVNKAENGETTTLLLNKLNNDSDYKAAVASADIITLTIGGNDLMAILYEFLAGKMNEKNGAEYDADDIKDIMEGSPGLDTLTEFSAYINSGFTVSNTQLTPIAANVTSVISTIKTLNPNAVLVVATQYNPYKYLNGQITAFSSFIGEDYKPLTDAVIKMSTSIETGLTSLNGAIGGGTGYSVADAYTVFKDSETLLCNAQFILTSLSINLDFHPNAAGHAKIAELMTAAVEAELGSAHTHGNWTIDGATAGNHKCGTCGHEVAHSLTETEAVAATCETAGNIAYWTCSVCGKYFSDERCTTEIGHDDRVIPATGHNWNTTEWKTDGSNHWYGCSVCRDKKDEAAHSGWTTEAAAAGHHKCGTCDYVEEHKYGTNWKTDDTNHWHECKCGTKKDEEAHAITTWNIDQTDQTKHTGQCTVCNGNVTREIYYTVSFGANGGSGTMDPINYDPAGGTFTLPQCTFAPPAGKTFAGWSISGRNGVFAPGAEVEFSGSIELTAVWKDAPVAEKPDPCDHKLDENDKCSRCGVVIVTYPREEETNPNTGAPASFGVVTAIAAVGVLLIAAGKKE